MGLDHGHEQGRIRNQLLSGHVSGVLFPNDIPEEVFLLRVRDVESSVIVQSMSANRRLFYGGCQYGQAAGTYLPTLSRLSDRWSFIPDGTNQDFINFCRTV